MIDAEAFLQRDRYAVELGVGLVDAGEGRATCRLALEEQHRNGMGTVHGGVIFGLADFAFALAANSYGVLAVAVSVHISYLKAVRSGTLLAEASEVSLGGRLASYTVRVTDDAGDLCALFQGMVYRRQGHAPDGSGAG